MNEKDTLFEQRTEVLLENFVVMDNFPPTRLSFACYHRSAKLGDGQGVRYASGMCKSLHFLWLLFDTFILDNLG